MGWNREDDRNQGPVDCCRLAQFLFLVLIPVLIRGFLRPKTDRISRKAKDLGMEGTVGIEQGLC